MRCFLRVTAFWAGLGLLGAAAVVGLGLYNVSARDGHFPGVAWILHTTFRHSVALRAPPASEVPDLSDPGLVVLGAGHYDTACRFCHAAPGEAQSATARAMNPPPPHITEAVSHWSPAELHWIVANGVKMSGMPGWPTPTRSDDAWAVVAFLDAVAAGMDAAGYAEAVAPPDAAPPPADASPGLAYCATCHGMEGRARGNPHLPRLDILSEAYLAAALEAYLDGDRESGIMRQAVTRVPRAALPALAAHFADRAPETGAERDADPMRPAPTPGPPSGIVRRGAALAASSEEDVPACRACHGPWPEPRNPAFPDLAGQHAPYIAAQLRLWRDRSRGGNRQQALMAAASRGLSDDQIAALAAYYAGLPVAAGAPSANGSDTPARSLAP